MGINLVCCGGSLVAIALACFYAQNYVRRRRQIIRPPPPAPVNGLMDLIGNTPLVLIPSASNETGCKIYAKCEFLNPCGSSKDRVCKRVLQHATQHHLLKKGGTVIEASSGSTGISLTRIARSLGFRVLIVLPSDIALEKQQLIRQLGGEVELVLPSSIVNPLHFVNVAKQRSLTIPDSLFVNQFENELNFEAHYEETGPEILNQLPYMDAFVASAGTGGTLGGVSKFLKSRLPNLITVLADCEGSGLCNKVNTGVLYTNQQSERTLRRHRILETICEGIGLDRMTRNVELALPYIDYAIRVDDGSMVQQSRALLREDGFFVGSSSALNVCAAIQVAKKLGPGHVVVTVFPSSGEREVSKLFNDEFCHSRGLL